MSPTFSIEELAQLTGKDRRTVKKRLGSLEPTVNGGNAGIMYESTKALPLIYEAERGEMVEDEDGVSISWEKARTLESIEKRVGIRIDNETKMKSRIPIEVANDALDSALGEITAIFEKSELSDEAKKLIREEIRNIPASLRW